MDNNFWEKIANKYLLRIIFSYLKNKTALKLL